MSGPSINPQIPVSRAIPPRENTQQAAALRRIAPQNPSLSSAQSQMTMSFTARFNNLNCMRGDQLQQLIIAAQREVHHQAQEKRPPPPIPQRRDLPPPPIPKKSYINELEKLNLQYSRNKSYPTAISIASQLNQIANHPQVSDESLIIVKDLYEQIVKDLITDKPLSLEAGKLAQALASVDKNIENIQPLEKFSLGLLAKTPQKDIDKLASKYFLKISPQQLKELLQDRTTPNAQNFAQKIIEKRIPPISEATSEKINEALLHAPVAIRLSRSDPDKFVPYIKINGTLTQLPLISKEEFYKLFTKVGGDPKAIQLSLCMQSDSPTIRNHAVKEIEQALQEKGQWLQPPITKDTIESGLKNAPFVIRPSGSEPDKFVLYAKPFGTVIQLPLIRKEEFYTLFAEAGGDVNIMVEKLTEQILKSYLIKVPKNEPQENPAKCLHDLCARFNEDAKYQKINVQIEGSPGIDAGGLGRQFLRDILAGLCKEMQFNKCTNGLFRPKLKEDASGEVLPLTQEEKIAYQDLGKLFMFCLNAETPYPLGMQLDPGIFAAICKMTPNLATCDLSKPDHFDALFEVFKALNGSDEADQSTIKSFKKYLGDNLDETTLMEMYTLVSDDPEIEKLIDISDTSKIKEHSAAIQAAVKRNIQKYYITPSLAPIQEMIRGMNSFSVTNPKAKVQMQNVYKMNPGDLSKKVQGSISKEEVLKKLDFTGLSTQIQRDIRDWINGLDNETLKLFLFALSGSEALGAEEKIKIRAQPQIAFHTCFNQVDIPPALSGAALKEALDAALIAVKISRGFDIA